MPSNGRTATRRGFLLSATGGLLLWGCLGAAPARALPFIRNTPTAEERRLLMVNQRTGEIYDAVYHDGEGYLAPALDLFAHFARDLRADRAGAMDPRLLDLAADIQTLIGDEEPLILTHGFRTVATNKRLRNSARNSLHLEGRALDIAHPRISAGALHGHARALDRGGLGRYSSFIHIDTGPTRRW
jgi:uncharacterized protein YcbK (DUF882 family)